MTNKELIDFILWLPGNYFPLGTRAAPHIRLGNSYDGTSFDPELDDVWQVLKSRLEDFLELKSVARERYGFSRLYPPTKFAESGEITCAVLSKNKNAKIMDVDIYATAKDSYNYSYREKIRLEEFCKGEDFISEYAKELREKKLSKVKRKLEEARKTVDRLERLYEKIEEG